MGKYIYGIIEEDKQREFDFPGFEEAKVYTINYQALAAVVSDVDAEEIYPTRRNVSAHTRVQEGLMKEYALLPMSFGVVSRDADKVKKLLGKNYAAFKSQLRRVKGKVEWGVKVFWEKEAMVKELEGENSELTKLKARISAAPPEQAQDMLIQAGKLVERMTQQWKVKYTKQIYNSLKELSVDARLNDPIDIKNILNASFLVDKSNERKFDSRVYELDSRYGDKVKLKFVGPFPPYSFVNLKIEEVE